MGDNHQHSAKSENKLLFVLVFTALFMVVEIIGGFMSGSLALIADAGHMFSDVVALSLAWGAIRIARRPSDWLRSYGYHRFQVLASFANGMTLLVIAGWICFTAVQRFYLPEEVLAGPMLIIAIIGLVVNIIGFLILHGSAKDNLNMQGAMYHVLADMFGSIAAIAASFIIMYTGWVQADPLLSVVVALLIVKGGWNILNKSGHILLEGTPEEVDADELKAVIADEVPAVIKIHHVHIWSLTDNHPILTLHAHIAESANYTETLVAIHHILETKCGIKHATVQIEYEDSGLQKVCQY